MRWQIMVTSNKAAILNPDVITRPSKGSAIAWKNHLNEIEPERKQQTKSPKTAYASRSPIGKQRRVYNVFYRIDIWKRRA